MKYNKKTKKLFPLIMNIFFLNSIYSFDNSFNPEENFSFVNYVKQALFLSSFFQYLTQLIISNNNNIETSDNYIKVPSQNGADCGFHAIKNGKLIDFLLASGMNNKQIEEQIMKIGFPQLEIWRTWTKNNFNVSDWLDDHKVSAIAEQQAEIDPEDFTTIPNIHNFNPVQIAGQPHFIEAIRKLNSQENFKHIFFIGNMEQQQNARGHWITIIAQRKNGKIIFRIADSLGGQHSKITKKHREIIESEPIFAKMQFMPEFDNRIETTENRLYNKLLRASEREKINGAVQALEEIDKRADELGLLSDPTWRKTYYKRTKKLVNEAAQRAHKANDETNLKKLRPLQYTFCD
jgi:hypothetical protein